MTPDPDTLTFRPSRLLQVFYTAPVLLAVVLLIQQWRAPARDMWIVIAICLALGALAIPRAWTKVTLGRETLTLAMPLRRPRSLHLRQLIAVERSERMGHTLLLRYHPMDDQGRLDIANQEFMGLVPLEDQQILLERLETVTGQRSRSDDD
jgi:hypothetical protein